jgi:hypothetical protein
MCTARNPEHPCRRWVSVVMIDLWSIASDYESHHARLPIQAQDHAGPDTTISHRHNYKP